VTSAIVVGGAVGGLAAARALAARGLQVTVLERRPEEAGEGAGLLLYPPAAHALERLGALDAFRARSVALAAISTYDQRGRVLNRFDATAFETRYGHPLRGVHRADLLAALAVDVRRGEEVTDIGVGDQGRVRAAAGWRAADRLVGADGSRSLVREARGLGAEPRRSGWVAWRGVTEAPAAFDPTTAGVVVGKGRHGGWVPVADGRVYWFLTGAAGEPGQTLLRRLPGVRGGLAEARDPARGLRLVDHALRGGLGDGPDRRDQLFLGLGCVAGRDRLAELADLRAQAAHDVLVPCPALLRLAVPLLGRLSIRH